MSSIEMEPSIKLCLKYLQSGAGGAAELLRLTLDEHIRGSLGAARTLAHTLPARYLAEERGGGERARRRSPPPQHAVDGELAFDLLEEDLTCAVCRLIAVQAGNRLVECGLCHALYHQDCHKPVIGDNDISGWQCATCLQSQGFPAGFSKAGAKSPPQVSGTTTPVKVASSPSASSSPSKVVTPSINIISADKRLQIMKKKAAKHHDKGRKSSK